MFLLSDCTLPADAFRKYEVLGLTVNHGVSKTGYACFTKTLHGNGELYKWLVQSPVIAFVKEAKSFEELDAPVLYSTDGEDVQLDVFSDNGEILRSSKSCTSSIAHHVVLNALDCGRLLCGSNSKHSYMDEILNGL